MIQEFIDNFNALSPLGFSILIIAGFMVGWINTIAGSGSAITYSIFMLLGMPASMANGSIRVGVVMQTLAASGNFWKHKVLNLKEGLILGIPTIFGTVLGAYIASITDEFVFEKIVGVIMIFMLFMILYKPQRWIKGKDELIKAKFNLKSILIFFGIGIYGGFIHIGVGIFLLSGLVLASGYDLVRANALKVFIVLLYSPFALGVFIYRGQIDFDIALIASIGNLLGGFFASKFAVNWGASAIRWVLVVVLILFIFKLFGVYNLI